jgi:hypothetical protein
MKLSAKIPRMQPRKATRAAAERARDILRESAASFASRSQAKMMQGLAPDGDQQRGIQPSTKARGTRRPLVRSGLLSRSWRVRRTTDGAIVRMSRQRTKVAQILESRRFRIFVLSREDSERIQTAANASSADFANDVTTTITVDKVGGGT